MIFWIAASFLTAAMVGLLFRPLLKPNSKVVAQESIQPADVYKAQLAEVEREAAAGLLAEDDAASAKIEIARRILRASKLTSSQSVQAATDPRGLAIGLGILVVAMVLGGYIWLGQPGLPAAPFAARDLVAESAARLGPATQELERQLQAIEDPVDRAVLLGDAFASVGALDEAREAYLTALNLRPTDADILSRLGEADLVAAQGLVTPSALVWFDRALAESPDHPSANFYRARYDHQQGNNEAAEARLVELLASAPEGASYVTQVAAFLAEVRSTNTERDAILDMSEADREALIREMVAGLAARLEDTPDDFDGWLRLANAYGVLGEQTLAQDALSRAALLTAGEPLLEARVADLTATLSAN